MGASQGTCPLSKQKSLSSERFEQSQAKEGPPGMIKSRRLRYLVDTAPMTNLYTRTVQSSSKALMVTVLVAQYFGIELA